MKRFLQRNFEQIRRSLYALFFQLPWLPEMILRTGDWSVAASGMRRSGKMNAFTDEDIEKYKEAWSKLGAMTAIFNWYRAAVWYRRQITNDMHVRVLTLML